MTDPAQTAPPSAAAETRPRRIAVVAHASLGAGGVSVGKNMISALGRAAPQHKYLLTIPVHPEFERAALGVEGADVVVYRRRHGRLSRWWYETVRFPRLLRAWGPDAALLLGNRPMRRPPCPQAALIQRAQLFYPSAHYGDVTLGSRLLFWYHKRYLRKSLPQTDVLLCQTEAARSRLIETYGFGGKIVVCPNAVSTDALADPSAAEPPEALAPLAGRMKLLFLARFYGHKNHRSLIELFRRHRDALGDVTVVTTVLPEHHPRAGRFLADIERHGLGEAIVNVGPIPQEQLAAYYRNCQGMFFPSLLESFSSTYIEAMHFGTPILTSDLDFAHDVCGDAAAYFDPWDADSMAEAILRLKGSDELSAELVARGRRRLKTLFRSWDEIGRDVAALLADLAGGTA